MPFHVWEMTPFENLNKTMSLKIWEYNTEVQQKAELRTKIQGREEFIKDVNKDSGESQKKRGTERGGIIWTSYLDNES